MDMISFGMIFLELVFGQLERLPGPGEEVFTDEFAISAGGAVTSATAAALGGVTAGVCTRLGDDLGSQLTIEHCATVGIDLTTSIHVAQPTAGITVVLNFAGDRGFVTHIPPFAGGSGGSSPRAGTAGGSGGSSPRAGTAGGSGGSSPRRDTAESLDLEVEHWIDVLRAERPAWCYLHAGRRVPRLLRTARELGCKVMLDISLGDERAGDIIIECIKLADIFVPNSDELRRLTETDDIEQAIAAAAAWGTQLVVTRGAAGALVSRGDGSFTEVTAGVREVEVKDLTGAGDNFAGALIAALHTGMPLTEAVVLANEAGSRAVGQLGAIGQIGAATGAGWPLCPLALDHLTTVLTTAGQADLMERG